MTNLSKLPKVLILLLVVTSFGYGVGLVFEPVAIADILYNEPLPKELVFDKYIDKQDSSYSAGLRIGEIRGVLYRFIVKQDKTLLGSRDNSLRVPKIILKIPSCLSYLLTFMLLVGWSIAVLYSLGYRLKKEHS